MAEAETIFREALALYRKLLGDDNREVANLLNELGLCLRGQDKLSEAELMLRDSLDAKRRLFGDNHPDVAEALNDLALTLQSQGKLAGAEALLRESVEMTARMYGPEHRNVTLSLYNLAGVLRAQGRLTEAESNNREAVTVARKQSRPDWLLPLALNGLSVTLLAEDKLAEAEQVLRETLEVRRNVMGGEDSRTTYPLANLAEALQRQSRFEEAEQLARRSLALWEETLPDKWRFFSTRSLLGASLAAQKKYAAAEPLLISGYEGMRAREDRIPVDSRVRVKEALQRLAQLFDETGRTDRAAEWKQKLTEFEKVEDDRKASTVHP